MRRFPFFYFRSVSLSLVASQQGSQFFHCFPFAGAVCDQLNLRALGHAHGQNTQKALGIGTPFSFFHPNGTSVLICLLNKESRGPSI